MHDSFGVCPNALHLLKLHGPDRMPVPIRLTVDIAEGARVQCAGHEGLLILEALRADGGSAASTAKVGAFLGEHVDQGL